MRPTTAVARALTGVPDAQRTARYRCVVAYLDMRSPSRSCRGDVRGGS